MSSSSANTPLRCEIRSVHLPASIWKEVGDKGPAITKDTDGVDSMEATLFLDARCDLGEGILFDDDKNQLLWTDINHQKFYALDLPDSSSIALDDGSSLPGKLTKTSLPKMLGSFAMRPKGKEGFLCAFEDGFQLCRLVPSDSSVTTSELSSEVQVQDWMLSEPSMGEAVNPLERPSRLNDGRCDPTGKRFICGGYYGGEPTVFMKVFKCEATASSDMNDGTASGDNKSPISLTHAPIYEKIQVTNSICFHGTDIMYLADSPQKEIYKFPYNCGTGTLDVSAKVVFHKNPQGVPDGSCTDQEGYVWNAVWRTGAGPSFVHRLHPETGEIVFRVKVPIGHGTSQLTCCCFGGPNFDILFITSAAEQRDPKKEPYAGAVYAAKLPFKGKPEVRFAS